MKNCENLINSISQGRSVGEHLSKMEAHALSEGCSHVPSLKRVHCRGDKRINQSVRLIRLNRAVYTFSASRSLAHTTHLTTLSMRLSNCFSNFSKLKKNRIRTFYNTGNSFRVRAHIVRGGRATTPGGRLSAVNYASDASRRPTG